MIDRLGARPRRIGVAPDKRAGGHGDGGVPGGGVPPSPPSGERMLRDAIREMRATAIDPRRASFDTLMRGEPARVRGQVYVPPRDESRVALHKQRYDHYGRATT